VTESALVHRYVPAEGSTSIITTLLCQSLEVLAEQCVVVGCGAVACCKPTEPVAAVVQHALQTVVCLGGCLSDMS
jgi:hypothetical protein